MINLFAAKLHISKLHVQTKSSARMKTMICLLIKAINVGCMPERNENDWKYISCVIRRAAFCICENKHISAVYPWLINAFVFRCLASIISKIPTLYLACIVEQADLSPTSSYI